MKHSESEIIKALNVIKETCEEHECDYKCPFNTYGECSINELEPSFWNVEPVNMFKAFNE